MDIYQHRKLEMKVEFIGYARNMDDSSDGERHVVYKSISARILYTCNETKFKKTFKKL